MILGATAVRAGNRERVAGMWCQLENGMQAHLPADAMADAMRELSVDEYPVQPGDSFHCVILSPTDIDLAKCECVISCRTDDLTRADFRSVAEQRAANERPAAPKASNARARARALARFGRPRLHDVCLGGRSGPRHGRARAWPRVAPPTLRARLHVLTHARPRRAPCRAPRAHQIPLRKISHPLFQNVTGDKAVSILQQGTRTRARGCALASARTLREAPGLYRPQRTPGLCA